MPRLETTLRMIMRQHVDEIDVPNGHYKVTPLHITAARDGPPPPPDGFLALTRTTLSGCATHYSRPGDPTRVYAALQSGHYLATTLDPDGADGPVFALGYICFWAHHDGSGSYTRGSYGEKWWWYTPDAFAACDLYGFVVCHEPEEYGFVEDGLTAHFDRALVVNPTTREALREIRRQIEWHTDPSVEDLGCTACAEDIQNGVWCYDIYHSI